MDMCKFAEDSDTGYMRVSRHIISLVRKAEENMVSGGSPIPISGAAVGHPSSLVISFGSERARALMSSVNELSASSSSENGVLEEHRQRAS